MKSQSAAFDVAPLLRGAIIGTAVGDAIGLPREGLGRRRATRLFGGRPLGHRLVFGRGLCSDDTEHTCMAAQALLASGGDPKAFARSMAWRLRWWFVGLPAGVGLATAKACLKLWVGFPPGRAGVWSAGNGPAMRAAVLGVYAWDDLDLLKDLVAASTRLTHRDPAAEHGALAVALAAAYSVRRRRDGGAVEPNGYLKFVRPVLAGTKMLELIEQVVAGVQAAVPFEGYLESRRMTRGVSGYVNHTVPACLYCWLTHPTDYRAAVEQVVIAGGDADSTGAIVGALTGVTAGRDAIPPDWVAGVVEWPRTTGWMKRLADRLAADRSAVIRRRHALPLFWPGLLVRNILFLGIVLAHGVRRIFPPY